MSSYEPDDEPGFFQRYKIALGVGAVVLIIIGVLIFKPSGGKSSTRKEQAFTQVTLPPPPPPPPKPTPPPAPTPPPPEDEQPPKQDQMVAQDEVKPDEAKPDNEPPPVASDDAPLGTNNVGDGPPDAFGLAAGRGGSGGSGSGTKTQTVGGGSKGSKFGWYANQVQSKLVDALRNNPKTKSASYRIKVRIWPDATGRVQRAKLDESTGDAALDEVIRNEVLTGFQLQEAPPEDMPTPIVLRLTGRRPS